MFRYLSKFPVENYFTCRTKYVRNVGYVLNTKSIFPCITKKSLIEAWRPIFPSPIQYVNANNPSHYEKSAKPVDTAAAITSTLDTFARWSLKFAFDSAVKLAKLIGDSQKAFFKTNPSIKGREEVDGDAARKKRKQPKKKLSVPCEFVKPECWSKFKEDAAAQRQAQKLAAKKRNRSVKARRECKKKGGEDGRE